MMQIKEKVSLQSYNSMKVHSEAALFFEVQDEREVQEILRDSRVQELPKLVLGGGSNILFQGDVDALVLLNRILGIEAIDENEDTVLLRIGGGENWHQLVMYCVDRGWGGIENLALIPGTVGAAPIQNIGAYGVELVDVFEKLDAIHLQSGNLRTFGKDICRFGYRDSIFKNELKGEFLITRVYLRLQKKPVVNTSYKALSDYLENHHIREPGVRDVAEAVIAVRNSKLPDPDELPNCGSFFKNPVISQDNFDKLSSNYPGIPGYPAGEEKVKVPAGWLIEQAGWKGKSIGKVGTFEKQALVIVNHGEKDGTKILDFAHHLQKEVKQKFNIDLEREVNIFP
jgi:UDP-N-acetylmuramate dehydrogenase